jgi:hypothetical protein
MAQAGECLPRICEALGSVPDVAKKKKNQLHEKILIFKVFFSTFYLRDIPGQKKSSFSNWIYRMLKLE